MAQAIDRHRLLYHYQKPSKDADLCERVGNVLLQPLRSLAGRSVKAVNGDYFHDLPTLEKIKKVFLALVYLIFSPVVLPITLLGLAVTALSSTHAESHKAHIAYLQKINQPKPEKKYNLNTATDIEKFLKTADAQKITEATQEAEGLTFTLLHNAMPLAHFSTFLDACDKDKLKRVVRDFIYRIGSPEEQQEKQQKWAILAKKVTPDEIEDVNGLDHLLELAVSSQNIGFSESVTNRINEKLRDSIKMVLFLTIDFAERFTDAKLNYIFRHFGEEASSWLGSFGSSQNTQKMLNAIFSTKINEIHPKLLEKALEIFNKEPLLEKDRMAPEVKASIQAKITESCTSCNLERLPPKIINELLKALPPKTVAPWLTEKAVLDCYKTCRESDEIVIGTETPVLDRLLNAIHEVKDFAKASSLFKALFDETSENEFQLFLGDKGRMLPPFKSVALVMASQDLNHPKCTNRLERLIGKLMEDYQFNKDHTIRSFQAIFKVATPKQSVFLWQTLNKSESVYRSVIFGAILNKEIFTDERIEAFIEELKAEELYEVLNCAKSLREAFLAMIRQKDKLPALMACQDKYDLMLGLLSDEELKSFITTKAASLNPRELHDIFYHLADKAWKRWDPIWSREARFEWIDVVSPLKVQLLYLDGIQNAMPTAFHAISQAFSTNLIRWNNPEEYRVAAMLAKVTLEGWLKLLDPNDQNAIMLKLPITKEVFLNRMDKIHADYNPNSIGLMDVIMAVSEGKTWNENEIQTLLMLHANVSARAFYFMNPELLRLSFMKGIHSLKLSKQQLHERLDAMRAALTEQEQNRYLPGVQAGPELEEVD